MDTLLSMRVFRAVVELESFVRAAERLELSAAMASKHVMHLERHLDARLLNRSSRHLSLTESGRVYFDQCRDMLDSLDEVEATLGRTAVVPRGTLKLSAPVWFANPIFTRALAAYRTGFPEVGFDIDLSGRAVNLVEEGFDLALRVGQAPAASLIARPLGPVQFHLVAAPAYLERAGRPRQAAELARHAAILYTLLASGTELVLDGPLGRESVRLAPVLQTNNESLMHAAVLDGMGVALLPSWQTAGDLAAGRLERLLPGYAAPAATLYAVYTSRRYLSSKVRTFIDFLAGDGRLDLRDGAA
ncbi:LysR family transcriptional regulator [Janthinobacterium fluminis]|uniref:LysR family transcriptional regulator n=1 Tax=Janthinobacterium fluminis TaxID=2987524 RepID=A0ABT5JYJ3_9BURK|nr:LysR family transcriptional regulator [Janthinobacterium fluminis]MDC8757551.1 LysR family transcriptional regulator [Janthinobacterium fluminis]